ncbi:MAG: phosphatidylserine decarboxylase [Elusimicrobiota bacterium]|jgi:phosphatidylserine decarboxylase
MIIAVEGTPFILSGLLVAGAGYAVRRRAAGVVLLITGLLVSSFCAYFFRDPDRSLPADASKIYSPADGRVLSVDSEGALGTTVRIFLSVFDVHVQRMPCSGVVEEVHYTPGSFVPAMDKRASGNERNTVRIGVKGREDKLEVEQIAGFIARRIVCRSKVQDSVTAGERYGLIRFGSQAALRLPPSARVLVQPGERVQGGVTPVAQWVR